MELCNFVKEGYRDCITIINKSARIEDLVFANYGFINCKEDFKKVLCSFKKEIGVYIFYSDEEVLYVGQCHVFHEGWSLFHRLKQHFQNDYILGLFNKVKSEKFSNNEINCFNFFKNQVKLKCLCFGLKDSEKLGEDISNVFRIEHFLISTLNPKYNNQE